MLNIIKRKTHRPFILLRKSDLNHIQERLFAVIPIAELAQRFVNCIIGKTNRDEIQNQMRLKFARKLQKRNVTEKSRTSYSQKWLSNVN